MIRPLAAALALIAALSVDLQSVSADTDSGHAPSVLRLRGGWSFPEGDDRSSWCAGGSVGVVASPDLLISISYDHIAMHQAYGFHQVESLSPVTLEVEVGKPLAHRIVPRLAAGAGPYFHDVSWYAYQYDTVQRVHSLQSAFGMHFDVGLSVPLWKHALMDFDYRYHQTVGDQTYVVGTATAGLRFVFPGSEPDPKGYVMTDRVADGQE